MNQNKHAIQALKIKRNTYAHSLAGERRFRQALKAEWKYDKSRGANEYPVRLRDAHTYGQIRRSQTKIAARATHLAIAFLQGKRYKDIE